jgi:hypothetical protein
MVHTIPTCKCKGEVSNELLSYASDLLAHDVVFRSDVPWKPCPHGLDCHN